MLHNGAETNHHQARCGGTKKRKPGDLTDWTNMTSRATITLGFTNISNWHRGTAGRAKLLNTRKILGFASVVERCGGDTLSRLVTRDKFYWTETHQHHPEKCNILFSRLENPPSTLFSSSIEFSTMEVILLYSASIAMSHSRAANCRLYSQLPQSPPPRRGSVRNNGEPPPDLSQAGKAELTEK